MSSLKDLYSKGLLDLSRSPELQEPRYWQSFIDSLYEKNGFPLSKRRLMGEVTRSVILHGIPSAQQFQTAVLYQLQIRM